MSLVRSLLSRCLAVAVVIVALACSSKDHGTTGPVVTPASLRANGTSGFTATVGSAIATPPSVLVTGSDGKPFAGAAVTFSVASGGGQVTGASATSNSSGVATVGSWTLGQAAGANSLSASLGSLTPVTFTATGTAGAAATMAIQSGDGQNGAAGTSVAAPVSVKVSDSFGNGVPNVAVTFQVTAGGGSVTGGSSSTNAQGIATPGSWVLGPALGVNHLSATAVGLAPVQFTATATAGAAAHLVATAGDAQAGDLNAALGSSLTVKATDAQGNGVPQVPVTFTVTTGAGTLSAPSTTTDATGQASTTLTLTAAGTTVVTARSTLITGVSAVFTESTGPTIAGTVTIPPGLPHPFSPLARRSSGVRASFSLARGGSLPDARVSPADVVARLHANRSAHLIVTYRASTFGFPAPGQAYRGAAFSATAARAYYDALETLERAGRLVRREVSPAIAAVRVEVPAGMSASQVATEIRSDPRVLDVEEDQPVFATPSASPSVAPPPKAFARLASMRPSPTRSVVAPLAVASELFSSDPLYEAQLWHYNMIDVPRAWPITTGSASVRVAVVDGGIRPDHPAVAPLLSSLGDHFDFTDATTNSFGGVQTICNGGGTFVTERGTAADVAAPRNAAQDPHELFLATPSATCWTPDPAGSQGTHIAGLVGSLADDGVGGAGINQSVSLISVRVLGVDRTGFEFDAIQGVLYAAGLPATYTGAPSGTVVQMQPAAIMVIGWTLASASTALQNAIQAAQANTLIVAASGDDGSTALNYPAALPGVLAVGALDEAYALATYSTANASIGLVAPGGDVRLGPTSGVLSSTWNYATGVPNYSFYTGTAMAAAHVAGVAALLKAKNPAMTPSAMIARLEQTAIDLGAAGRDDQFGFGLVNARNALTNTMSPNASTTVRLVSVATGAAVRSVPLGADGHFAFTRLQPGDYYVLASQDENGDGIFAFPGRRFNWAGGSSAAAFTASGTSVTSATLTLSSPAEAEPNDDLAHAQALPVDSWVAGSIAPPDLKDVFSVLIPAAGIYTFETSGVLGSCGYGLELDTELTLLDGQGSVIEVNDDTPYPQTTFPGSFCSMITRSLAPGRYYVVVSPFSGSSGTYRLHVRAGT